jgi:hypothetical protein
LDGQARGTVNSLVSPSKEIIHICREFRYAGCCAAEILHILRRKGPEIILTNPPRKLAGISQDFKNLQRRGVHQISLKDYIGLAVQSAWFSGIIESIQPEVISW